MIPKLKAIGLVLAAVFAMSAIAASTASAQQGKLTSDGPVTLTMVQRGAVGSAANALTAISGKIECPASAYKGHKSNVTPHELIESGSTAITVTPTYINCFSETSSSVFSTTADMNGCDYVLNIGKATGEEDSYGVTTDVVCPEGQKIQWTVFLGTSHTTKLCTISIKPQTGLSGAHVTTNTASDTLGVVGTVENVHIEESGLCGNKTTTEGKIDLDLGITGRNGEGGSTGLTVTS